MKLKDALSLTAGAAITYFLLVEVLLFLLERQPSTFIYVSF